MNCFHIKVFIAGRRTPNAGRWTTFCKIIARVQTHKKLNISWLLVLKILLFFFHKNGRKHEKNYNCTNQWVWGIIDFRLHYNNLANTEAYLLTPGIIVILSEIRVHIKVFIFCRQFLIKKKKLFKSQRRNKQSPILSQKKNNEKAVGFPRSLIRKYSTSKLLYIFLISLLQRQFNILYFSLLNFKGLLFSIKLT